MTTSIFNKESILGPKALKAYVAEMIGMFFFLFVGLGVINSTFKQHNAYINGVLVPINNGQAESLWGFLTPAGVLVIAFGFGVSIVVLVYGLGHISGGHFNPAVTLACVCFDGLNPVVGFFYWIAQILGGAASAGIVYACWPRETTDFTKMGLNALSAEVTTAGGFFAEFFGTALLTFTIFGVAVSARNRNNSMAPFSIGLAVFLCHILLIPITGCSINPARSSASAIFAGDGKNLWIYWIAPLSGGVFGAGIHWLFFIWKNETETTEGNKTENAEMRSFRETAAEAAAVEI